MDAHRAFVKEEFILLLFLGNRDTFMEKTKKTDTFAGLSKKHLEKEKKKKNSLIHPIKQGYFGNWPTLGHQLTKAIFKWFILKKRD